MTPDKEQVVEPLNADEEAIARRTHRPTSRTVPFIWVESGEKDERVETSCARCEEEWPCGASRLLATLDAERGDRERQFREWKAAQDISVAEWQRQIDAARTASVAGLDRSESETHKHEFRCTSCDATHSLTCQEYVDNARLLSAPSIEQEPGESRIDVERAAIAAAARLEGEVSDLRTQLAACTEAYTRLDEQEPGETLRAAAQQAARVLEDFNTGPSIMARVALRRALEADRNPQ